jgi:transcriptional regulator with XRE-family HTH domain
MKQVDLKRFMFELGIKQSELAKYLGVSEGYISQVASGKKQLSNENLSKVLNNPFGWDTSMLVEEKAPSPAPSQTEQVDMVIELLKAQNADLQAKVDALNQKIGELQALLKKEREELAEIAGTSLSADAS